MRSGINNDHDVYGQERDTELPLVDSREYDTT